MWLCPSRRPRGVGADRGAGNVPHASPPRPRPMAQHPGRASRPLLTPAWHLARPQSHTRHASTSIPLTRRGAGPDAQLRAGARPAPRPDAKPAHPRSFRRHPFCLTYPESILALTAPLDKLSPGFEGHQKAHLQVLSPDSPTLLAQALAGVPPMEASPPRCGPGVWPTPSCRLGRSFQAEGEQRAGASLLAASTRKGHTPFAHVHCWPQRVRTHVSSPGAHGRPGDPHTRSASPAGCALLAREKGPWRPCRLCRLCPPHELLGPGSALGPAFETPSTLRQSLCSA